MISVLTWAQKSYAELTERVRVVFDVYKHLIIIDYSKNRTSKLVCFSKCDPLFICETQRLELIILVYTFLNIMCYNKCGFNCINTLFMILFSI